MKASIATTVLAALGVAQAAQHRSLTGRATLDKRVDVCNVGGRLGSCRLVSGGCPGGAFDPAPVCDGSNNVQCCITDGKMPPGVPPPGGELPTLNSIQTAHAHGIIDESNRRGFGKQGCLTAIVTVLTESSCYMYASEGVPDSFKFDYDKVGHDHDSIGLFQQRISIYKDLAGDMDAARSAGFFFDEMVKISGWQTMDPPVLAQRVQRSAAPQRYFQFVDQAHQICAAAGFP